MTIGEKIACYRTELGMTQKDLGKALNVSAQAVSKWENGQSEPDVRAIKKMCKIFDISTDEFLDNDYTPQKQEPVQPIFNVTMNQQNTRIINGYCEDCKRPVGPGEYVITHSGGGVHRHPDVQHIYCKSCHQKHLIHSKNLEYEDFKKHNKLGYIWGPIAAVVAIGIMLAITLLNPNIFPTWSAVLMAIAFGVCYFTFVMQAFWEGVVIELFFFFVKSFTLPGVIFGLDIDSIIAGLIIKIALAILGVLASILWFLFGFLIVVPIFSLFAFPFACVKRAREGKEILGELNKLKGPTAPAEIENEESNEE